MEDKKIPSIEKPLFIREKVVFLLVIFLIRMIKPWEYDHHFDKFWTEIKEAINKN